MTYNKKTVIKKTRVRDGIAKRGDLYYVVLRERDPETGKTKPIWTSGFADRDSAKAYRDQRRQELRDRKAVVKSALTVAQYLEDWMQAPFVCMASSNSRQR
jgi:integrase